ncbi:hypothetical protein A1OE_1218 [Candidatus Endolissoclinum faulkneri L2]|uniref:Uncharacterized protein n=1 Tax=Candidatus Endolissoclinum faulkneri L2 TaxID=1193729 RepID=K7Z5P9_9PROT|nr:hypothetical protein A1OE_1218 [Candidatus Endolissoclinum faulkneri L2]
MHFIKNNLHYISLCMLICINDLNRSLKGKWKFIISIK